jgi:hypothetical protein
VRRYYGQLDLDALLDAIASLPKTPSACMLPVLRNYDETALSVR